MPEIPALEVQEDHKCNAILDYIISSELVWTTVLDLVSKNKYVKIKKYFNAHKGKGNINKKLEQRVIML